jgi:hypothetical protein
MTGLDMPEFDELDPEPSAVGDHEDDAPDWLGLEQPDDAVLAEPQENRAAPADPVTESEGPVWVDSRNGSPIAGYNPASRNGQNGHGEPRPAHTPRRRAPAGRPAPSDLAAPLPDDNLPAALAAAAAVAPDSEEAALLAAGLVPLALAAAGSGERVLRPAVPALVKGIAALAMWLIEEDRRGLIRLLPLILEGALHDLSRAASDGRTITRGLAGDVLAEHTESILSRRSGRDQGHIRRSKSRRGPAHPNRPADPPKAQWDVPDDDDYR